MKKIYPLICLYCFFGHSSFSQKENNIWYFGYNAGVSFNSGSPIALTNSAMSQYEGCSSVADASGNLLFYTDGITIWNKNHLVMTTGLSGNSSATQSGLIVKQPGNANLYYVFSTNTTYNYSIVDMTLNSGLGGVTATKNVLLVNGSEKQCAVRHSNGTDVWIMSHESASNGFNAFLLKSTGLNIIPVKSNAGIVDMNLLGGMKFSPKGDKVAFGIYDPSTMNTVCVCDFNNTSGIVSGGFSIPTTSHQCYGLSFSPDGSKLYADANFNNDIYQYDMSAGTPAAIIASAVKIGTESFTVGTLQIGPDSKLYISPQSSTYLDVINNPNAKGLACNFMVNAVSLSGKTCGLGLPNLLVDAQASVPPPVTSFQASDTDFCSGNCISFTNLSVNATGYQWTFAGAIPASSTDQNPPFVCYLDSGAFSVSLVATNAGGSDTLTFTNYITVHATPLTPVINQSNDTLYCSYDPSYVTYQWYADTMLISGATNSFVVASQSGNYNVSVSNVSGCSIAVGINVILGIPAQDMNNVLSLYPNPVQDYLYLDGIAQKAAIYNMIGETVYAGDLSKKEHNYINCSYLSPGLYHVVISNAKERYVLKFIKL